ncbi:hypothetical protein QBC46DRAFT_397515 [Diplogelasinospora grovesii]|uniref:Uncharacterized protein n=1 Tax=Diplogelasinospora grovesii TaxID=303347 RepID=A0AAN6RZC5_9PEZI|nr:hypothetical protein QBC46DRAFT_397515 [Diplogelasinospora grovesii]
MFLKRKRSDSELSSVSSSTFSSPPRPGGCNFDFGVMMIDTSPQPRRFSPGRASTPSHLPSRTRKRFRDSRPADAEVHQRTLNLLYSAQQNKSDHHMQQQRDHGPISAMASAPQTQRSSDQQQRSLHSFWKLPNSASSSATASAAPSPPIAPHSTATSCEDCGAGLCGDGDDSMMDVDDYGFGAEGHSCGACGKVVCFSCSVSNLGEHRRCLACAKRTTWGGSGKGWAIAGFGVC